MKTNQTPYKAHLFVCCKSRGGERKSCGDGDNAELKEILKSGVKDRGWKGLVRVSDSGCMGLCESGPNIMIHPQQIWLSDVSASDLPRIFELLEELLAK